MKKSISENYGNNFASYVQRVMSIYRYKIRYKNHGNLYRNTHSTTNELLQAKFKNEAQRNKRKSSRFAYFYAAKKVYSITIYNFKLCTKCHVKNVWISAIIHSNPNNQLVRNWCYKRYSYTNNTDIVIKAILELLCQRSC